MDTAIVNYLVVDYLRALDHGVHRLADVIEELVERLGEREERARAEAEQAGRG